jgi:hypothetical protein
MGRKPAKTKIAAALFETRSARKICPRCTGGDGENKEIYDTAEDARRTAQHIKAERGIQLKIYQCEFGNGWHLTKDNDYCEINGGKKHALQDIGIPLRSAYYSGIRWEYVDGDSDERAAAERAPALDTVENVFRCSRKLPREKPAIKAEAGMSGKNISITGVVVEIIKNISIEKIFNINLQNILAAKAAKIFLDDEYQQITVLVKSGAGQRKSYTALVKKTLMQKRKIIKGDTVSIAVIGECINGKNIWRCLSMS